MLIRYFYATEWAWPFGVCKLPRQTMNFNALLAENDIDQRQVLVMRHRPPEPELRKILPWLAAEKPAVFNAYQQTQQNVKVEKAMQAAKYVASFIGHEAGRALFIGLYSIRNSRPLNYQQFWAIPAYKEMKAFGMKGWVTVGARSTILWFDLALTDFCAMWKGKLIVRWPPPELSWWRRADRNDFPIEAILQDNALDPEMPAWDQIKLRWDALDLLPTRWRSALSHWRGIYYIFDESDGKGYIGSAYGRDNLLGRWRNYAQTGHGGNILLRQRKPNNFNFTILELVSPTLEAGHVIRLETTWKDRLHTRAPYGLNDN
jgi:GIY-YIG catalytic domain